MCPSVGVTKSSVIFSLNELNKLVSTDKGIKYNVTTSGGKITINSIYGDDSPFSRKNINYDKIEKAQENLLLLPIRSFVLKKNFC